MSDQKTSVTVPVDLFEAIAARVKTTEFESVEAYVTFVLREILSDGDSEEPALSEQDEAEVQRKLRDLGYME